MKVYFSGAHTRRLLGREACVCVCVCWRGVGGGRGGGERRGEEGGLGWGGRVTDGR